MSHIAKIRDLHLEGKSIAEISRKTSNDYKTIKKYIDKEDFSEEIPMGSTRSNKLDPYKEEIANLIENTKDSWHKQQLTAVRIRNILKKNHEEFDVSYNTVQRFVKNYKVKIGAGVGNGYSRLYWHPGEAQADFGEADFIAHDGELKRYKYFVLSFPYSNKAFTQIYSGENCECVCQALINTFENIKGVPTRIVFDNATGIGRRVSKVLQENTMFQSFRMHYRFIAKFANPYSGNEKGNVESNVGFIRRNLFSPEIKIPKDIEKYNKEQLFDLCDKELMVNRIHYIKKIPVNELFKDDKVSLSDLPGKAFAARRVFPLKVNGYGEIILATKHLYTLAEKYRNTVVTVVTTAWKVEAYTLDGMFIEAFDRAYGDERTETMSLRKSLNSVLRKPNSWINSKLRTDIGENDPFVQYLDTIDDSKKISNIFKEMKQTIESFGFDETLRASQALIENKRELTGTNLSMYCQRLEYSSPYYSKNPTGVNLNKFEGLMSSCNKKQVKADVSTLYGVN
jgi:transposase